MSAIVEELDFDMDTGIDPDKMDSVRRGLEKGGSIEKALVEVLKRDEESGDDGFVF